MAKKITERQVEQLVESIVEKMQKANELFLTNIGEMIKKLKNIRPTEAHKLVQILKYGGNYEEIINKLTKVSNMSIKQLDDIFEAYSKKDSNFAEDFYNYRNIPFKEYSKNSQLIAQTEAIRNMAKQEMYDFTRDNVLGYTIRDKDGRTIFRGLRQVYNDLLDEAFINVGQGKETFDSAMRNIIKDIGTSGLKTVDYKSGRCVRLDSIIRMHLHNKLNELHNENQKLFGEEYYSDGVEISVHENPAPDHEEVQGRQFSNEEYKKLQDGLEAVDYKGNTYQIVHSSNGSYRPISEMNCYHNIFSIVLGVSEQEYSDEELQKIRDDNNKTFEFDGKEYTRYEGTQLQRKIETEIRKQKDLQILAKASDNKELIADAQERITILNYKYKDLCDTANLPMKKKRLSVSGYKRTNVRKLSGLSNKVSEKEIVYKDYTNDILKTKTDDEKLEEVSKIANKFNEEYKEVYESMTDDEKFAYNKFTSHYYKDINKHMLGQNIEDSDNYLGLDNVHNTKEYEKEIDKWVDNIENVINRKKLGENTILYKGTLEKYFDNYKEGDIFTNDIFYSTTLTRDIGETFMWNKQNVALLKIKAQKGIPSIFSDFELEITLSKNQKYKFIRAYEEEPITDYFKGKKIKVIEVEAIK